MDFSENVFCTKKYSPINDLNGLTLFSSLMALGDQVNMTSILELYERDNPDELILYRTDKNIALDRNDCETYVEKYGTKKVFWASDSDYAEPYPKSIFFHVPLEACEIAREKGIYPEVPFGLGLNESYAKGLYLGKYRYITVNLRNITHKKKTLWKNFNEAEANHLFRHLKKYAGKYFDKIIIVGNDQRFENNDYLSDNDLVIDKRNILKNLGEVSFVLQNSVACIGKDSGMLHLAAACRIPVFGWNYEVDYWKPISRTPERCTFLMHEEDFAAEYEFDRFFKEKI